MLTAFWSGIGQDLARYWVAKVLTPALAFWAGGLGLVWWNLNSADIAREGWPAAMAASADRLGRTPAMVQGALIVGALVLIAASAAITERLTLPVLRLMEGYWTRPAWLYRLLVDHRRRRYLRISQRITPLQRRQRRGALTVAEYRELSRLRSGLSADPERRALLEQRAARRLTSLETTRLGRDTAWLLSSPDRGDLTMPTRLGDILRAAESRPGGVYGIDAVICWGALWFLLPPRPRTELAEARAALDSALRGWLWGAAFVVWTPFSWWALAVTAIVPLVSYRFGILPRAIAFGQLVDTCYDLYRMGLYDAMHLPRPTSPEEERTTAGPRLTRALAGTLVDPELRYLFEPPPDAASTTDP